MRRRRCHKLSLLAGALALPLCLARCAQADPFDADLAVPTSVHADDAGGAQAAARSARDTIATAGPEFTTVFDRRAFDVERFEAALPRDMPATAARDAAEATTIAADSDASARDVERVEAALPPDIPAPATYETPAAALAAAGPDEGEPPPIAAAEAARNGFDVALFEAALPREVPASTGHGAAAATAATAHPNAAKPAVKSAALHPGNRTPAAKQPLPSSIARGKTTNPARASLPAARKVAAVPPATIPLARPRAAKPERGPRELYIARVPPSDRDEVMPALPAIPVIRAKLPAPALALK